MKNIQKQQKYSSSLKTPMKNDQGAPIS